MSTAEERVQPAVEREPRWLGDSFWNRLHQAEVDHQRIQSEHECVRRTLESLQRGGSPELQAAWQQYCAVIAELDRTTAELEALRTQAE